MSKLDALKIERSAPPPRERRWLWPVLAVISVLILGGLGWYFLWPSSTVAVHVATARGLGGGASSLDASGYVVARRQATLSAKILGKLIEINAEEGKQVTQGTVVARLDDSNYAAMLTQARAQALQARIAYQDAGAIFARYTKLHAQGAISTDTFQNEQTLYDAARTALGVSDAAVGLAEANERDTIVRAPFAGIVTDKVAQVGEIVAPSAAGGGDTRTGIVKLVDMDSLEVEVDVSENYIDRVRTGGPVTIHLDAYPDWEIPGSVIAIIPTADQTKGTVKVRIAIAVKDHRILPEMGARVSFLEGAEEQTASAANRGVLIPAAALQGSGSNASVFLVKDDGTVEVRGVTAGVKSGSDILIRGGLQAGDRVATDNFAKLADGVRIDAQP